MRIIVYIDGFNLYFGALKHTPFKWLDLHALSKFLFPNHEIVAIKYFTAHISARSGDDIKRVTHQQIYLRALRTLPNLEIFLGFFLTHKVRMMKADLTGSVEVLKTEEKGTDVNIATHAINDGHQNLYDRAVIISNDSDLVEPVKIIVEKLKKQVVVVNPRKNNAVELVKVATSMRKLRKGVLKVSQFSEKLTDANGEFSKPEEW